MAKKQRDEVPNPSNIQNRDIIQRLNFLYQASTYLNGVEATSSGDMSEHSDSPPAKRTKRRAKNTFDLSRSYIDDMRGVGKKALVRMDPTVKRTLCKKCSVVLMPGTTARVRVKGSSSHGHAVTYSCLNCDTARRIPAPPVAEQLHPSPADHGTAAEKLKEEITNDIGDTVDPIAPRPSQSADRPIDGTTRTARRQRRKKAVQPRVPPLFERDVGHVIFRGNEKLVTTEDRPVDTTTVAPIH